ncbi:hypothetical protein ACFWBF_15345 [Streptomyces sp. NPDC060028]|uniref:hypothetical protein n=1 Tax=Streptomyces sp. NPDC060028 TaxID=3347041 RepID=UPI0036992214
MRLDYVSAPMVPDEEAHRQTEEQEFGFFRALSTLHPADSARGPDTYWERDDHVLRIQRTDRAVV